MDQKARLDTASTRIVQLKDRRDEGKGPTSSCCMKLVHVQKSLAVALKKMKASLALVVALAKDQDAVATKSNNMNSSVGRRMGFASKEVARLETKVVKVTQKPNASVAIAEQLSLEAQCVPGLAEEVKKLCEHVSVPDTIA